MTDNVRKIFDILGVEPNEEFKVDGYDYRYYIDSSLDMCAIVPSRDIMINLCGIFIQILKNPKLIIKIPKKKKLRDFTPEDYKKWRCNNCARAILSCEECIFDCVNCDNNSKKCWVNNKDLYSDKFLDQELEVEE